ncbi:MAG: DUF1206 domain-containing protein [Myxococcales bacterium]|nr:DUF1206 domain-containing protein [Myxococcales bacterium]
MSAGIDGVRRAAGRNISERMEKLMRVGFFTKGVVYLILGVLAASAALGSGGQVTGSKGAISVLGSQPFGTFLLWLVGFGLAAYALWRLASAIIDPENEGSDAKGIAKRVGYLVSGILHTALAVAVFQMAAGSGSSGGNRQTWIAMVMQESVGRWLIFILGIGAIAAGLKQLVSAKRADFHKTLRTSRMSPKLFRAVTALGRLGFAARGVVFGIIGYYAARAALNTNPSQVVGIGGALRKLSTSTGDAILLVIVALGLAAYGVYMLVASRYRAFPAR